jgi:hypothetical protein
LTLGMICYIELGGIDVPESVNHIINFFILTLGFMFLC